MREWGAEALTALIKAGLAYKHDPPLAQNQVCDWHSEYLKKNLLNGVTFSGFHPLILLVRDADI